MVADEQRPFAEPNNATEKEPPPAVEVAFRCVQPWYDPVEFGWDGVDWWVDHHPLTQLSRLSNADKHRALHLTTCALDLPWAMLPEGAVGGWTPAEPRPWLDGAKVGTFVVTGLTTTLPAFDGHFAVTLTDGAAADPVDLLTARLMACCRGAHVAIANMHAVLYRQEHGGDGIVQRQEYIGDGAPERGT